MNEESSKPRNSDDVPASLRRRQKVPYKSYHLRIPYSWWEELRDLSHEFDQDVSVFLREAIEDWLRRARTHRTPPETHGE